MASFNANDFPAEVPLGDWIVQNLSPNSGRVQAPETGTATGQSATTNNYIRVTGSATGDPPIFPGNTTQISGGYSAEVTRIEITSPVVVNSNTTIYPDFQLAPRPDRNDTLINFELIDGTYGTNMLPPVANTVGQRQVVIGEPWFRVAQAILSGADYYYSPEQQTWVSVANAPLLVTGIKLNSSMGMVVSSQRGWGAGVTGDTVVTPARVRMWGYQYTPQMLELLASAWNGHNNFSRRGIRRTLENLPAISGTSNWQPLSSTWTRGPNGWAQTGGSKIWRYFAFAPNANATSPNNPYLLTNASTLGADGNVGNAGYNSDLGWPFAPVQGNASTVGDAVILQEFGVPTGITNIAYAGIASGGGNGSLVPAPKGFPLSTNVNDIAYGQVSPQRTGSALFYALPRIRFEGEFAGENAAAFVTDNGTAIPAYAAPGTKTAASNSAVVAVGGLYIVP